MILDKLKNCELSGITFVQDYVQFSFYIFRENGRTPCLSAYTWPRVKTEDGVFLSTQPGYRDALCSFIGKYVLSAYEVENEKIVVKFEEDMEIIISLKQEDRVCAEAAMIQVDGGQNWEVW